MNKDKLYKLLVIVIVTLLVIYVIKNLVTFFILLSVL